jgi:subtilisin family serine protease
MKRWGLLGLLAVTACAGGDEEERLRSHAECPNVEAGALPAPDSLQSALSRPEAEDGRVSVLVRYRGGSLGGTRAIDRNGGQVTAVFQSVPALAMRVTPQERATLEADPEVESIEPDLELRALGLPRQLAGTLLAQTASSMGSTEEYTEALKRVQAHLVWDTNLDGQLDSGAPTGTGIRVCVIDSGLDLRHPELLGPYKGGRDFVDRDDDPSDLTGEVWGLGHGTHVAGIIAAQLGSSSGGTPGPGMSVNGMAGVAPGVELLIARVLDVHERASTSNVIAAIEWCQQQGAKIATMSLGTPMPLGRTMEEALRVAAESGMLLVAASGNDSSETFEAPINYPAAYSSVLSVGAVDDQEVVASFSNRGRNLGLVAPGVDVLSSVTRKAVTVSNLEVGGSHYDARSLYFAPAGDIRGELVDCGKGESRGCQGGTCDGFVAYVRLSAGYSPNQLAANVMRQGARAIVFGVDESESQPWSISLSGPGQHWVPTVAVGRESRAPVLKQLGRRVRLRLEGVDYARFPGTSMATPHVTAVAALVWSKQPSLQAAEVRKLLENTAKDLGAPGHDSRYGHGLVQAKAALDMLQNIPH